MKWIRRYIRNEGEDEYKVLHIQHIKMEEEDVEDEITRLWLVWIFIYFYFFLNHRLIFFSSVFFFGFLVSFISFFFS